jgi:serine/threonine-protein kinase
MTSSISTGTKLGRYEIRAKIGEGGMGEVYLADDTKLGRQLALKILARDLTENPEHLQRFEREARAASALNHPNIVTVYEIGEADGAHFIATEYIGGQRLSDRMKLSHLKCPEVLDAGIQIASALAAAHEAGIIHRDIKPDNIVVRKDGLIKVLDFGIAKLTKAQEPSVDTESITKALLRTTPGVVMGTTKYMSPEQARGYEVDERTDIWSLGVVLYRMVSGSAPFDGDTMSDVIASILRTEPPTLTDEIPRELQQIIDKALQKRRRDRYQRVSDMLHDLKECKQHHEFLSKLATSVPPEPTAHTSPPTSLQSTSTETSFITQAPDTMTSEYIAREVKRHNRPLFVVLAVLIGMITVGGLIALGAFAYTRYFTAGERASIDSLAVLPFANVSGDAEMEYLSDGLTESLINNLSQLPGLKVIARSSSFRYKGKDTNAGEVARALGVNSVLTGRVLRHGDNLQIHVELVDARDNTQMWGAQYNRSGRDLMAVQQEIAQEISRNLRLKLSRAQQDRVGQAHTASAEAYELYLKGRFYWNKRTAEALLKSVEYFNQAIEKDPNYALAYAGLAEAHIVLPFYSGVSTHDSYPKAKTAARRALELDPSLAEARTALAAALMDYDWNLAESNKEFERAIQLNPNYPNSHHWYARENLTIMGQHDRAIAEMHRAQELDPLSLIINANLGKAYFNARRYDEAIRQLLKTIEIDSNFFVAHHYLGSAYAMKGANTEALASYQKARQLNENDAHVVALLGRHYAVTGDRAKATEAITQLKSMSTQRYVADYNFALIYAALGEKNKAFESLEKSFQSHTIDMLTLHYDPLIDNLRSEPRFGDLVRRVGLR